MGTRKFCCHHLSGEDIYLFTLRNTGLEISITNYGCIITSFKVKLADGSWNDIVLGFDNVEDYLSEEYLSRYPYFGAVIGRYGNRIKQGSFHIDGIHYELAQNRGPDHLHGGLEGFDKKVWSCVEHSDRCLVLKYTSRDGEEGYPGKLDTMLKFELTDDNELVYEFEATTDNPTPVNLTHHSYFNLNNGQGNISDHQLKINSSQILEQDVNLVVTGNEIPVANSFYDFRIKRKVGDAQSEGYDQSFVLDEHFSKNGNHALTPAAEVSSRESGLSLQIYTSEPLVHFYSGRWIPPLKGKKGINYQPFSGLCLETQKHPNAINIPHFPDTILRPGDIYHSITKYKLTANAVDHELK